MICRGKFKRNFMVAGEGRGLYSYFSDDITLPRATFFTTSLRSMSACVKSDIPSAPMSDYHVS